MIAPQLDDERFRDLVVRHMLSRLANSERVLLQRELQVNGLRRDHFLRATQRFQREAAGVNRSQLPELAKESFDKAGRQVSKTSVVSSSSPARRTPQMEQAYREFVEGQTREQSRRVKLMVASTIASILLLVFVIQAFILWSRNRDPDELEVKQLRPQAARELGARSVNPLAELNYLETSIPQAEAVAEANPSPAHDLPSLFTEEGAGLRIEQPSLDEALQGKPLSEMLLFRREETIESPTKADKELLH